ncbi:anhydro-N-acetylmuramic acid kinase [Pseudidiomarina mangrovi]|uniref:anhydro-N-acetylmuramic acid kinase n=1 Tax=Pseudidiomarina mangrovi TaxID=2487133 RepID=UPI000FCC2926|nr:anhydro-N-acetylmuramic acid kinase [Pseudidiomarina mangrovi]
MTQYYVGLMSGTSMDGLDAVLVDFSDTQPRFIAHYSEALPEPLAQRLHQLCQSSSNELHVFAQADREFAQYCAVVVHRLLQQQQLTVEHIVAIGSHGQTIRHQPYASPSYTLQLGDPNTLACLTGIAVVADFRRKDIALGGQGAPLVPAFHQAIFANNQQRRIILNLGGIANITVLPGAPEAVIGFDTGPANTLLDQWFGYCHPDAGESFDRDGAFAANGQVDTALLKQLLQAEFFQRPAPKSTGRDDFNLAWLKQYLHGDEAAADVQATLVELTAASVAMAINGLTDGSEQPYEQVFVCGGGVYNSVLMAALQRHLPRQQLHSTATLGVQPQHVEAMAFAWLAYCFMQRIPANLPAVTGASRRAVLGGLFLPD